MWALPDISRLNTVAEKNYKNKQNIHEKNSCDYCNKKALIWQEYYDVFSNYPKGEIALCEGHHNSSGIVCEGYFYCNNCGKLHIENYTWEDYYTIVNGEQFCLNCALDIYLSEDSNFIHKKEIDKISFDMIRKAPHLIPVAGTYDKKILNFVGNVEFDNTDGHCINGDDINDLKEFCAQAIAKSSKKRCVLILDGAYQFAISIGIYYEKI